MSTKLYLRCNQALQLSTSEYGLWFHCPSPLSRKAGAAFFVSLSSKWVSRHQVWGVLGTWFVVTGPVLPKPSFPQLWLNLSLWGFAGICVYYDPTWIFLKLNLWPDEILEISGLTASFDRWGRPHAQYEYFLTFSYSWLIPQGFCLKIYLFFLTGDTVELAKIQINTSSPHFLSPDLLSQRGKTSPLRLLNTWGPCAVPKPSRVWDCHRAAHRGSSILRQRASCVIPRQSLEESQQMVMALLTSFRIPMGLESSYYLGRNGKELEKREQREN